MCSVFLIVPISQNMQESGSFWISGMKFFAWFCFLSIIIAGAVISVQPENFVILLASVAVAFVSIAGIMIFLDMARDVSEIKNILKNK